MKASPSDARRRLPGARASRKRPRPKTTIVLAEALTVVREGLRLLLDGVPGFEVVGEAATGPEAVAVAARLKPDVLVAEMMLPGLRGPEVARRVGRRSPATRVVILTQAAGDSFVHAALANGASSYVLKESDGKSLVTAILEAAAGRRYLAPPLPGSLLEAPGPGARPGADDLYETLTDREREVLLLTAEGLRSSEIAERLEISSRTAETHRGNVMRKLGLRTRTQLIRFALQRGLLPLDPQEGAPTGQPGESCG